MTADAAAPELAECTTSPLYVIAEEARTVLGVWLRARGQLAVASSLGRDVRVELVDLTTGARAGWVHAALPEGASASRAWRSADGSALFVWEFGGVSHLGRLTDTGLVEVPPPEFRWYDEVPPRRAPVPVRPQWIAPLGDHAALFERDLSPIPRDSAIRWRGYRPAPTRADFATIRVGDLTVGIDPAGVPGPSPIPALGVVDTRSYAASGAAVPYQPSSGVQSWATHVSSLGELVILDAHHPSSPVARVTTPMLQTHGRYASLFERSFEHGLLASSEAAGCGPPSERQGPPDSRALRSAWVITPNGQIAAWSGADGTIWFAPLTHNFHRRATPTALHPPASGLIDGLAFGDEAVFTVEAFGPTQEAAGHAPNSWLLRLSRAALERTPSPRPAAGGGERASGPERPRAEAEVLVTPPVPLGMRTARMLPLEGGGFVAYSIADHQARVVRCAAHRTVVSPQLRPLVPLAPADVPEAPLVPHFAPAARPHRHRGVTYFYEDHPGTPWSEADIWDGVESAWKLPGLGDRFALVQFARRVREGVYCGPNAEIQWGVVEQVRAQWLLRARLDLVMREPRFAVSGLQAYVEDLDRDGVAEIIVRSTLTVAVLQWDGHEIRLRARVPSEQRIAEVIGMEQCWSLCRDREPGWNWRGGLPTRTDPRCGAEPPQGIRVDAVGNRLPPEPPGYASLPSPNPGGPAGNRDTTRREERAGDGGPFRLPVRALHFVLAMRGGTLVMVRNIAEHVAACPVNVDPGAEETLQFRPSTWTWQPIDLTAP